MVRPRKVSTEQVDIIVAFMEEHRDLARNRLVNSSTQGQVATRLWIQLSNMLNEIVDGEQKDRKGWKNYWNELKYKVKKKVARLRLNPEGSGQLTESDQRILAVIGTTAIRPHSFRVPKPEFQDTSEYNMDGQESEEIQPLTSSAPTWAIDMEHQRMEDDRRRIAALETISNTLIVMQQELTRLVNHVVK